MQTRPNGSFQTEAEFTLPKGYLDATGILHRKGVMRLATAADEILPLRDVRVQQNPAYLAIIVLARVVTRLGELSDIDTKTIEGLYASDLDYLQRLYERLNSGEADAPLDTANPVPISAESIRPAMQSRGFRTVGES
ncbi:hypothetical protein B0G71_1441 [Paraburkholderia sp. BL27I4N3]|uniref:hypothetical protein n=1 Tax=Paraburkholderia sp. BL27I4N3 TaxID=1938805 RepID=UPI000E369F02|nr:hypothetical protein [Paraburkholderia sp. BL27I4N3]REE18425.1 hypothetical protein B0G71_1441 [Paraburkholderia sp. BL27I4N3]